MRSMILTLTLILAVLITAATPALAAQDGIPSQTAPAAAKAQAPAQNGPVLFDLVGRAITAATMPVRVPLVWAFTSPQESANDRAELVAYVRGQ